jgi:V-type H+-transporting ATPase subunit E
LKLLQRREEQLQELFSIARTSILTFAEDEGRYSQFLEGAVVQGFLQLMETRVTLHVREQDADIVKMAGELAADTYTGISKCEGLSSWRQGSTFLGYYSLNKHI